MEEAPIVDSFFHFWSIDDITFIELVIGKKAYGWMHSVLDVKKVLVVS